MRDSERRIILMGMFRIALIAALAAGPALAQEFDGFLLRKVCDTPKDTAPFAEGICLGMIGGYFDGMNFGASVALSQAFGEMSDTQHSAMLALTFARCLPQDITRADVTSITLDYLNANPSEEALPASTIIASALADAFPYPCTE